MGLLDDAIRDHLDLKRRRGADPTEIAREEREALEPVFPDEPRPPGFEDEPQAASVLDEEPPHGDPLHDAAAASEQDAEAPRDAVAGHDVLGSQTFGEETAEIDMEAVLEEQDAAEGRATAEPLAAATGDAPGAAVDAPGASGEVEQMRAAEPIDDELLEWETPGRADAEPPPEPLPGQERMSFE